MRGVGDGGGPDGRGERLRHLRYAGVAAIVILWVSMAAGMHRTGLGFSDERPLSYLGTDARSWLLFRAGLISAAVLLAGFGLFVHERFSASRSFLTVFLIGMAGQIVAAIVPISGAGAAHDVHVAAGITLGLSLPVMMWRFAASQPAGRGRSVSYGLLWVDVAACLVGIGLSRSMRAPIAEVVPALAFHLWIAVVTVRAGPPVPVELSPRRRTRTSR